MSVIRNYTKKKHSPGIITSVMVSNNLWKNRDFELVKTISGQADSFGECVAVSPDGNTMAVGIPLANQVKVYRSDASTHQLTLVQTIDRSASITVQNFGQSMSISKDGSRIVVGFPGLTDDHSGFEIFAWNDTIDEYETEFLLDDGYKGMGTCVSVDHAGLKVVVGSPLELCMYIYVFDDNIEVSPGVWETNQSWTLLQDYTYTWDSTVLQSSGRLTFPNDLLGRYSSSTTMIITDFARVVAISGNGQYIVSSIMVRLPSLTTGNIHLYLTTDAFHPNSKSTPSTPYYILQISEVNNSAGIYRRRGRRVIFHYTGSDPRTMPTNSTSVPGATGFRAINAIALSYSGDAGCFSNGPIPYNLRVRDWIEVAPQGSGVFRLTNVSGGSSLRYWWWSADDVPFPTWSNNFSTRAGWTELADYHTRTCAISPDGGTLLVATAYLTENTVTSTTKDFVGVRNLNVLSFVPGTSSSDFLQETEKYVSLNDSSNYRFMDYFSYGSTIDDPYNGRLVTSDGSCTADRTTVRSSLTFIRDTGTISLDHFTTTVFNDVWANGVRVYDLRLRAPAQFNSLSTDPRYFLSLDNAYASSGRFRNLQNNFGQRAPDVVEGETTLSAPGLWNVDSQVFPATDGFDADELAEAMATYPLASRLGRGQRGCAASHLRLWATVADRVGESRSTTHAWIFEDDAQPCAGFTTVSRDLLEWTRAIDDSWDMVYMGVGSTLTAAHLGLTDGQYTVSRVPAACLHGYILSQDGARALLDWTDSYRALTREAPGQEDTLDTIDDVASLLHAVNVYANTVSATTLERSVAGAHIATLAHRNGLATLKSDFDAEVTALALRHPFRAYSWFRGFSSDDASEYASVTLANTASSYRTFSTPSGFSRDRGVVFQDIRNEFQDRRAIWMGVRATPADVPEALSVTGGHSVDIVGDYTYHRFTAVGTSALVVTGGGTFDVLVVGGGGSGGSGKGCGGGGGGGVVVIKNLFLTTGTYPVVVGAGGNRAQATSGQNSSLGPYIAFGGGRGGGDSSSHGPQNGGSGGGGRHNRGPFGAGTQPANTPVGTGYGNNGGQHNSSHGGGGGGSGAVGNNASSNSQGGVGVFVPEFASWGHGGRYGGGGAGGRNAAITPASPGGGGGSGSLYPDGIAINGTGLDGMANTGGGGGGGGDDALMPSTTWNGGNGGSGTVIIRYLTPV